MEAREAVALESNDKIADFRPGDTVKVNVWIREGERQRQQAFQGVVIRKREGGPSSSFTVRRVASGVGVERSFLFHSPNVESVEVVRRGKLSPPFRLSPSHRNEVQRWNTRTNQLIEQYNKVDPEEYKKLL